MVESYICNLGCIANYKACTTTTTADIVLTTGIHTRARPHIRHTNGLKSNRLLSSVLFCRVRRLWVVLQLLMPCRIFSIHMRVQIDFLVFYIRTPVRSLCTRGCSSSRQIRAAAAICEASYLLVACGPAAVSVWRRRRRRGTKVQIWINLQNTFWRKAVGVWGAAPHKHISTRWIIKFCDIRNHQNSGLGNRERRGARYRRQQRDIVYISLHIRILTGLP